MCTDAADDSAPTEPGPSSKRRKRRRRKPRALWVDKYRPRSYLDLLSDETINREVAQWLMAWRRCMDAQAAQRQDQGQVVGRRKAAQPPEHNLLLLCGPPGASEMGFINKCKSEMTGLV